MSESQKTIITDVANGLTGTAPQAQTILKMVFDETIEPWVPSDSSNARFAQPFEEPTETSLFEIFPNPAKDGSVLISANVEGEVDSYATVRIYSSLGSLISENKYQINSDNTITLPINLLSDGVYFVELNLDNYPQQFRKLLVQRN